MTARKVAARLGIRIDIAYRASYSGLIKGQHADGKWAVKPHEKQQGASAQAVQQ
jgi:hypothetical protein